MHERTMRAIARILFVACCAVPTLATMLVIVTTWTPWYHRGCLRTLESHVATRTGLSVAIGNFKRLTPTSWQLSDVALTDPETRRGILKVRHVWWVREGGVAVIRLEQPELQSSGLDQIGYLLHDRFLCRPEMTDRPVRIAADDLTIHGRGGAMTLRDVNGWLRSTPSAASAGDVSVLMHCVPAGWTDEGGGQAIEVTVSRQRSGDAPRTSVTLQTGAIDVPLAMLADHWPSLKRLGDDATFRGVLTATQIPDAAGDRWRWDGSGSRIDAIDLARLSESMPHRVSGIGELVLDRCQIEHGGAINVIGTFTGREGWMSAAWLPRLADELGWQVDGTIDRDFRYDLVATHFDLYASQLKLSGVCGRQSEFGWLPSDVVVASAGQAVVMSSNATLPATALARMVAPTHAVSVPIAGQTVGLLQLLTPPSSPLPGSRSMPAMNVVQGMNRVQGINGAQEGFLPENEHLDDESVPEVRVGELRTTTSTRRD